VHDAWNRLVKVVVGSNTILEQDYNGLTWRTAKRADSDGNGTLDEERRFTYSADWQLLEERVDAARTGGSFTLDKRVQHAWGLRYIDDAILHRADRNNDGDSVDADEGTWYNVTDAMFSNVALVTASGTLVERVTYDPYGRARHHWPGDVDADGDVDGNDRTAVNAALNATIDQAAYRAEFDIDRSGTITTADRTIASTTRSALAGGGISNAATGGPDNPIGWDGYVFNAETRLYTVRHRTYEPVLGRWMQRDPAGYVDGGNGLQYARSGPTQHVDPTGLLSEGASPPPANDRDPKSATGTPESGQQVQNSDPRLDPAKGCGIKVKKNKPGNGYGHHWIEIDDPDGTKRWLGFYPGDMKCGKDKGETGCTAFGGRGRWYSPRANPDDSTDSCECVAENDLLGDSPSDEIVPVRLDPEHREYDIEGDTGLRGLGSRPMRNNGYRIVRHRLRFGRGAGKFVSDATCDEIRDCLDRFVPSSKYFYGLNDCRWGVVNAMAACGLQF
jgi:RHS repeat-associated protein